jgi:hypothetical protein
MRLYKCAKSAQSAQKARNPFVGDAELFPLGGIGIQLDFPFEFHKLYPDICQLFVCFLGNGSCFLHKPFAFLHLIP